VLMLCLPISNMNFPVIIGNQTPGKSSLMRSLSLDYVGTATGTQIRTIILNLADKALNAFGHNGHARLLKSLGLAANATEIYMKYFNSDQFEKNNDKIETIAFAALFYSGLQLIAGNNFYAVSRKLGFDFTVDEIQQTIEKLAPVVALVSSTITVPFYLKQFVKNSDEEEKAFCILRYLFTDPILDKFQYIEIASAIFLIAAKYKSKKPWNQYPIEISLQQIKPCLTEILNILKTAHNLSTKQIDFQ